MAALLLSSTGAATAQAPTPVAVPSTAPMPAYVPTEGEVTVRAFAFASGERLPALRLHYATLGTPRRDASGAIVNAVMVLHGTGGSGKQFLVPQFAGVLYGLGQPLDLARWYVILPDGIGHGGSSKPSDGLHARFPHYDYADMVAGQRKVLDALGVTQLRLLIGTSMGCMHAFVWGEAYPGFARALLPLACQAVEISGRNRMWRKLAIDAITHDSAYAGGNYTSEPANGMRGAASILALAGTAPVALQAEHPTRASADAYVNNIEQNFSGGDANDLIWALEASRTYDPSAGLASITVPVTWINSGDDFINPPGLHLADKQVTQMPHGKFVLILESAATHGHGTHTWAALWQGELLALLARSGG